MKKNNTILLGSRWLPFIFSFLLILSAGYSHAQSGFRMISGELGITHTHQGNVGTTGGGVVIFDYNNDGFEDIYLTGGILGDELYKNNGKGAFIRISKYARLSLTRYNDTMCATAGDVNNDGYKDLFIGTIRNSRSLLYLNDGNGRFIEIGSQAGLKDEGWASAATFTDVNLDGLLDLYIANYVKKERLVTDDENNVTGFDHDCFKNKLYMNNGDSTFTDVSLEMGADEAGCALAVVASDVNQDNYPDLFIANDFGEWVNPNSCLTNQFPVGSFIDNSELAGLDAAIYGMGIAAGDYDRNGKPDFYITNIGKNLLYQNLGGSTFADVSVEAGVDNTYFLDMFSSSWGAVFFDYDLDGFEDLFVSNGHIPAASFIANAVANPDKLFRNNQDGTFGDVTEIHGMDSDKSGRGVATGDIDNDGDLDLVVININGGNVLIYENLHEEAGNWLKLHLEGDDVNRDAFGTKAIAWSQGIPFYRELIAGSSHGSQNSSLLHFGLGSRSSIDSLIVIWPGGKKVLEHPEGVNKTIYIKENQPGYYISGCMDPQAENFDPEATFNNGCWKEIRGCIDDESEEFNPDANVSDGSCDQLLTSLDNFKPNKFIVSPNPMRDYSMIDLGEGHLQSTLILMDLSGRILRQEQINASPYKLMRRGLQQGIYLLVVTNKSGSSSARIVLE